MTMTFSGHLLASLLAFLGSSPRRGGQKIDVEAALVRLANDGRVVSAELRIVGSLGEGQTVGRVTELVKVVHTASMNIPQPCFVTPNLRAEFASCLSGTPSSPTPPLTPPHRRRPPRLYVV